jgi:CSLREA domain-containing protein
MSARPPVRSVSASIVLTLIAVVVPWTTGADRANAVAGPVVVDTAVDSFDGSCDDGDCSLRDAIRSAPDGGVISVPSGIYVLSLAGNGGVGVGDLNLRRSVTIRAAGETGVFIDAAGLSSRAFSLGVRGVTATLRDLTIFGSRAGTLAGGALWVDRGTLIARHLTITGARVDEGGALFVGPDGTANVSASLFLSNRAVSSGRGGAIENRGRLTVVRSTLAQNRAGDGGAIWNGGGGELDVRDSTLSDNLAADRGGGLTASGAVNLRSVTVAGNESGGIGGGIARPANIANITTVAGTIVAGNRADDRGSECSTPLTSVGANVERHDSCGFSGPGDLVRTDPLLTDLAAHGGPTPTRALRSESPAVDLGGTCDDSDQRGTPRGTCDAGAYERVLCEGKAVDVVGTAGDDDLTGGRERDVFLGLGGNDEFQGSLDDDRACGGPGTDRLIGGPGRDRLDGGAGDDRLRGEEGRDVLDGGLDVDRCVGGPGRDRTRRCEPA